MKGFRNSTLKLPMESRILLHARDQDKKRKQVTRAISVSSAVGSKEQIPVSSERKQQRLRRVAALVHWKPSAAVLPSGSLQALPHLEVTKASYP